MQRELSELLDIHSRHCARCADAGSDATYTPSEMEKLAKLLSEAASIIRTLETAPECIPEHVSVPDDQDHNRPALNYLVKNGKRVKLVEVKRRAG